MSDKPKAIKVRTKGGKIQRIAVEDISTYREFEEEGLSNHTSVVVKSGKPFICDAPEEKIDELFDIIDLT